MSWKSNSNSPLGVPLPGTVGVVAAVAVGSIAKFFDDALGEGEFIYLPGVANTAAGDVVDYSLSPGAQSTTRHTKDTANNSGRPVAVATAATVASTWGWYQIGGLATVNVVAGTAAGVVMGTATAGQLGNTPDAGDQILGARVETGVGTPAAGQSYVTLARPHVQGQIT